MGYSHPDRTHRAIEVVLVFMLAVTMLPAAGLSSAFADEPVERPATSGGDVALEGANGAAGGAAAASQAPAAEERADGMLAADGLMYTVADGGLALVGFDGDAPEGVLSVPAAVMVDGKEAPVVAIDLAEGQAAGKVVVLSLPQSVKDIDTASLASALPALLSVEVAGASSTLPVAAGAASVRAAYSTSGGMLFRPTSVTVQNDDGSIESIECKELLWAPPALVSARVPVECRAIAEGAFADVRSLKTVVAFGTMERIADGAFSTEQMESSKVVVPQASAAVTDDERVSASMALMGGAGQKERRSAWHEAGWRSDDIVMGKPYGSLTEAVAVTDEGAIERDELQLVSYPGAHERAMDLKKPNAEGVIEQAESGLVFTVKSDMTASVTWQGDKTATPSHIDIPATIAIDGVTYPVTEIAPNAFEGAAFLTSVTIPEGVTAIGQDAFKDCPNLAEPVLPSTLKEASTTSSVVPSALTAPLETSASQTDGVVRGDSVSFGAGDSDLRDNSITPYLTSNKSLMLHVVGVGHASLIWDEQAKANFSIDSINYNDVWLTAKTDENLYWNVSVVSQTDALAIARRANGSEIARMPLRSPSGWSFVGAGIENSYSQADVLNAATYGFLSLVHSEVLGGSKLLTTSSFAGSSEHWGFASTPARSDHIHDDRYYTEDEINNGMDTKLNRENISKYDTNAKLDAKFDSKMDVSDFGSIGYSGLDGSDMSVYPTSYRKGGMPSLPAPVREGFRFAGWSWSRGGASGDSSNIADAFAEAGAVTLTANWEEPATPEAKHFFTSDAPLRHDDASAAQTHVIKVRLSSSPGTLASVSFEGDDRTGLLRETSGVRLFVGASEDALATGTELSWGGATSSGWSCELARFSDDSYGVYVGVSIPTAAIDEAAIPVSYADGSYVASLVKMNYAFA